MGRPFRQQTEARAAEKRSRSWAQQAVFCAALLLVLLLAEGCSDPLAEAREAEAAGDYETAVSLYELRLEEEPDDLEALRALTVILFLQQKFEEVLPYQERLVSLDPTDVQTRLELGFNYLGHQSRPGEAVTTFAEAVELKPTAKHLTFLAQAEKEAGDIAAAETTLRRAIDRDKSYGYAYRILIALLEDEGRTSEAEQIRQEAVENGVETGLVNAL